MALNGRLVERAALPLLFFAVKALKTHEALLLLAQRGYGPDAGVLARSLLELAINAAWISKDWPGRALFYLEHERVEVRKYQRLQAKGYGRDQVARQKAIETVAIEEQRKGRRKTISGESTYWTGKSLRKMATEVGLSHWYEVVYSVYSDMIHSAVVTARDYVTLSKDGRASINLGPEPLHTEAALHVGYMGLWAASSAANAVLDLGLDEHLREAFRRAPA